MNPPSPPFHRFQEGPRDMPVRQPLDTGSMTCNARLAWVGIVVSVAPALIVAAAIILLRFQSPFICFKFGVDKVLLRADKRVGLTLAAQPLSRLAQNVSSRWTLWSRRNAWPPISARRCRC
jgi:hypothetical protein